MVTDGNTHKSISIGSPFVLAGKHKDCQIQIEKHGVPDFAYLVVATKNKIEAWPLAAGLKFLSSSDDELSISLEPTVVSLAIQNRLPWSPQICDLPKVSIACNGNKIICDMKKSVMVIGSGPPSNYRIQGAQLATCDVALIYDQSRFWIVDLVAQRPPKKLRKRIDLFPLAPSEVDMGRLSISISPPPLTTGPAETLAQTVQRNSNDEIDLAARLSKLGQNQTLSWRSVSLIGLSLLALFTTVFALYQVIAGLIGQP